MLGSMQYFSVCNVFWIFGPINKHRKEKLGVLHKKLYGNSFFNIFDLIIYSVGGITPQNCHLTVGFSPVLWLLFSVGVFGFSPLGFQCSVVSFHAKPPQVSMNA